MSLPPDIVSQVKALPKVELHRHLEGCITAEIMLEAAREHKMDLPTYDPDKLRDLIQVQDQASSLKDFLRKFFFLGKAFPSLGAVEQVSYLICRDCARDNIRYAELRFSPLFMSLETRQIWDWEELVHHVLKGTRRAEQEFDIEVGLIVGISRSNPIGDALRAIAVANEYFGLGVAGIDLVGDEAAYPPELFAAAFRVAMEAGLNITVHAGEGGEETNIRVAVEKLGAKRIGHGVRIINDPEMMDWLKGRGIPLEICLTSNVKTSTVPSLAAHPVRRLFDAGIRISLSTDDPAICATTLSGEYLLAMEHFGFTLSEIKDLILEAADQAFLEPHRKEFLKKRLAAELA
jgi:adenosine deaminase